MPWWTTKPTTWPSSSSFKICSFKNSILDCKLCSILWPKSTWFYVISFIRLFLPTPIDVQTNSCIFRISRSKNFLCLCDDNDFGVVVSKQNNLNRHFFKWRSKFILCFSQNFVSNFWLNLMLERFWIEALTEPYIRRFGGGRLFNFVWIKNNFVLCIWIFLCCEFFLTIFIHIYDTSSIVMDNFLQSSYIYVWNLSWNLWRLLCNFIDQENLLCFYDDFSPINIYISKTSYIIVDTYL
jgi:hypothetical protein